MIRILQIELDGWMEPRSDSLIMIDPGLRSLSLLYKFCLLCMLSYKFLLNYCLYANKIYTILMNGLICIIPTTCGVHHVLTLAIPTTHKGCSVEEDYEDYVEGEDAC